MRDDVLFAEGAIKIPDKPLIESVKFPFREVSEASAVEKGPGRPPHWEMVFWWTRKPLISARAIIAGCLLPEKTSVNEFLHYIGFRLKRRKPNGGLVFDVVPHRVNPQYRFRGVKLLDPFAGFGSIPLEGLRLGLDAVAVELLPVAYVFLKAILEYPAKYGEKLIQDVKKWGEWVTERLREDPLIKELYEGDVAVYIGSWEVKCPNCGRWTPLVGNWWLARVKSRGGYERLAWMEPLIEDDQVKVQIVDLNKLFGDSVVEKAKVQGLKVDVDGKEFRVPESNIEAKKEIAICLLCNKPIMQIDPQTGRLYSETKNLPKEVRERLEGYVKYAIKTYNQSLEQESIEALARQRLLVKVKVKGGDLEFEPCTPEDQQKLEKAGEEVKKLLVQDDPDIPKEGISLYSARYLFPILYGIIEWYKLFNPRQLLTLVKLVKLIRETGKRVEEEYLLNRLYGYAREGIVYDSPETRQNLRNLVKIIRDALDNLYGDLALEIVKPQTFAEQLLKYTSKAFEKVFEASFKTLEGIKKVDGDALRRTKIRILDEIVKIKHGENILNDIREETFKYAEAVITYLATALLNYADFNSLTTYWEVVWSGNKRTMAVRGIAMMWNWCDVNPLASVTGTMIKSVEKVSESASYLIPLLNNWNYTKILIDDATVLSKFNSDEKFSLIVTDPPYYDDVPYAELSDFYYVWLKRSLSNVEDGRLAPCFLPEAFFERVGNDWVEVSTQWEKYALNEVSLNPPRLGADAKYEDGVKHFQNLLNSSFITMASRLEDNGLLVTYYAHTDPKAWKALLEAGWGAAGLRVTNAFPITTESAQSVVKRGKLSMDTSIVVVWRKGCQGSIEASELYNQMVEESAKRARELMDVGATGRDLVIGTLASSLAAATKYREIKVMGKIDARTLVDDYVYPATYLGLAKALALKAELKEGVKYPDAMFYLLVKSILPGARKKTLESTDLRLFSIGTSLDLNAAIKTWKILRGEAKPGAKVAKAKTYVLIEPSSTERSSLAEILEIRGVNPEKPQIRCAVDALHTLEYYAVTFSRGEFKRKLEELKSSYPAYVEEAQTLAKILAKILPKEDQEWALCKRIMDYLSPEQKLFPEGE